MKRSGSRAGSPTPTAFSGISNYRTESYRPLKDKSSSSQPSIDYRAISRTHFTELAEYLADYLARSPPNSRTAARQKLTRLTVQQFHELSTDVYDERMRRKLDTAPFLPVRDDFHPKRNQARQKLATLHASRFEDLSSDVYYELARRYPEFLEETAGGPMSPSSGMDDYGNSRSFGASRMSNRSDDRPIDSGYGTSVGRRSTDRRRPSEERGLPRRSQDDYAPSPTSRRRPSQDASRSIDRERDPFPRRPNNGHDRQDSASTTTAANPANAATRDVIIPNKSTMEEEYIEVPFGREMPDDSDLPDSAPIRSAGYSEGPDTASEYPTSPASPPSGLNALSSRLRAQSDDDDDDDRPPAGRDNFFGRSSVSSDRSVGRSGRPNGSEDVERIKRDYEFKLASMQSQISELKRDLASAEERGKVAGDSESKVEQLSDELSALRRHTEEQGNAMRALRKELEGARENLSRERERELLRQREDEARLRMLQDRIDQLEESAETVGAADMGVVEQLRDDMEGLLAELSELSHRNDELEMARESDMLALREMEAQMKDYKRKYEQAKTELRSMKATSQLFSPQPLFDSPDQLPVSPDGGVLDIHVTAFLSAIDSLLTAARSNSPGRVLHPMKLIVNAVSTIIEDAQAFERRPARDRNDIEVETLRSLIHRAEATLSNLVTASKTHAASAGMSPVSLLDAAASHVAATMTDIGKTISIRRATRVEQDQFASSGGGSAVSSPPMNATTPLRSIDEGRSLSKGSPASSPVHLRNGSTTSTRSYGMAKSSLPNYHASTSPTTSRRHVGPPSDNSSDGTTSPPAIFDQPTGLASDESVGGVEGTEDAWAELKPYLEAQTESIVYAIQNVLSDVRTTTPSPKLSENLTQIITIVASIVAVCNDNLPPGGAAQGTEILRELSDHANRLSEVQNLDVTSKESRQTIAKHSFAIANAMKALMKL